MRREPIAGDGITTEQERMNRVIRKPVGVIGIGIAAGEAEDPMGQQVTQRMLHLPRLPIVHEAAREPIDQSVPAFRRLQQDGAAIGARLRLVERRDEGLGEEVGKENSLWYRVVAQSKASVVGKSSSVNGFVPCGGFCVSTEIGPFVNYPG